MQRRILRPSVPRLLSMAAGLFLSLASIVSAAPKPLVQVDTTYMNPLKPTIPGGGIVESCADPSVIKGEQPGDQYWYMYCTADPLNDEDQSAPGVYNFHLVPMFRSLDLVNWTYEGDAFTTRPAYATPDAGLWAPEIEYFAATNLYHLYYTVTDTTLPGGGRAIGVATSSSPLGPWAQAAAPAVEPHPADCCPGSRRDTIDPEVIQTGGVAYIYYGSYFGGVSVRRLSADGLISDPLTQTNVGVANKYEGPEVVFRDGFFYLFASATNCCNGPLTAYGVFVGRSTSPTGPFLDRDGVDMNDNEDPADSTDGRVGGTPVIFQNGNRWVGPGHNTVFQDYGGQWWTIYHAVDRNDPYFADAVGFTKRPALLDAIDWIDGWPTLNGGRGPSDSAQPAPAAQPGEQSRHAAVRVAEPQIGTQIRGLSDEFSGTLGGQWQWVREPAAGTYAVEGDTFRLNTQDAELFEDVDSASVLTEAAPGSDYVVETRVRLDVPPEGCCFNYRQAGLVIYGDDDNYVKLTVSSIWNTRQTEFGKEQGPVPAGYPRYGNTVVGAPGEWTWLRIVKRSVSGAEAYQAFTSRDGINWTRGGVWTHTLGASARIGLIAYNGPGNVANFDYVRVSTLAGRIRIPAVFHGAPAAVVTGQ